MQAQKPKQTPQKTSLMLQSGHLAISKHGLIQKAYIVCGETRSGKTTLVHAMMHSDLIGVKNQERTFYQLENCEEGGKGVVIGNDPRESETQIPNIVKLKIKNQDAVVIDLPGSNDTEGCLRETSNRFFVYSVFERVQKMRFIIVVRCPDLYGKATNFVSTVKGFLNYFNKYEDKIDEIAKNVCFVITFTPPQHNFQTLKKSLSTIKLSLRKDQECYQKIFDQVAQNGRIFFTELAVPGKKIQYGTKKIEQQIAQKMRTFWQRKILPDSKLVDMSPMSITLGEDLAANKADEQDQFLKDLGELGNLIEIQLKDVKNMYTEITNCVIKDASKDEQIIVGKIASKLYGQRQQKMLNGQNKELYKKYDQERKSQAAQFFSSQCPKNNSQNVFQKTFKVLSCDLVKMIQYVKIEKICQEVLNDFQGESKKYVKEIPQRIAPILGIIMNLAKKINNNLPDEKTNLFCFMLYQKIEIFSQLSRIYWSSLEKIDFPKAGKTLPSQFKYMTQSIPDSLAKLFQIIDKFFMQQLVEYINMINPEKLKKNEVVYIEFGKFIIQIIQKLKGINQDDRQPGCKPIDVPQCVKNFQMKLVHLEFKQLELKICSNQTPEKNIKLLQKLRQKILELQESSSQDQEYFKCLSLHYRTLHLLGAYAIIKKYYQEACIIFEIINDPEHVLAIYQLREEQQFKKGTSIKNIRLLQVKNTDTVIGQIDFFNEYAGKALSYGKKELSMQKFHHAYSLALSIGDTQKVLKISKMLQGNFENQSQSQLKLSLSLSQSRKTSDTVSKLKSQESDREIVLRQKKLYLDKLEKCLVIALDQMKRLDKAIQIILDKDQKEEMVMKQKESSSPLKKTFSKV